jgi:hypothetical protein
MSGIFGLRRVLTAVMTVKTPARRGGGIQKLESLFRQVRHLTALEIRGCQSPKPLDRIYNIIADAIML